MTQPEARDQKAIVGALAHRGIPAWRIRQAGLNGWPDIYGLARAGRALHIEVKRRGERPTPLQWWRLRELRRAGALCAVVQAGAIGRPCAGSALRPAQRIGAS